MTMFEEDLWEVINSSQMPDSEIVSTLEKIKFDILFSRRQIEDEENKND